MGLGLVVCFSSFSRASISCVDIGWTRNFKWTILLRLLCSGGKCSSSCLSLKKHQQNGRTARPPSSIRRWALQIAAKNFNESFIAVFSQRRKWPRQLFHFFPPCLVTEFADARRCTENDEGEPASHAQPLQNAKAVSAISGNFTVETLHWLNPTNLFIWSLEIHVLLCSQGYCGGKKQGY